MFQASVLHLKIYSELQLMPKFETVSYEKKSKDLSPFIHKITWCDKK